MRRINNKFALRAGELQAAPILDIVFLLLIFFIMTAIFAVEEGIPLVLPARTSVLTRVKQKDTLEISAYPDGRVVAEGSNVGIAGVRALVQRRLAENRELVVVLVTRPNAEYGLMVDLLDEIKLANCRRISFKPMGG